MKLRFLVMTFALLTSVFIAEAKTCEGEGVQPCSWQHEGQEIVDATMGANYIVIIETVSVAMTVVVDETVNGSSTGVKYECTITQDGTNYYLNVDALAPGSTTPTFSKVGESYIVIIETVS